MNALKRTRLDRGYTISQIAELAGIPISTYAMIESGERSAGKEVANQIGKSLDVNPTVIFLPERFTVREYNCEHNETSATKETA